MVGEVFAGLSAFTSMFNIAKSMKDMNDAHIRNAAISVLWEHIFTCNRLEGSTRFHNLRSA